VSSFLIDPHVHTAEISSCSRLSAPELVRLYRAAGYQAIVVADHFGDEYFESRDLRRLPWRQRVECFLEGYRRAQREGKRVGLQVFLGAEVRLADSPNDYLVYGLGEEALRQSPPLCRLDLAGLRARVHRAGGIVVQAHPFRPPCAPADPRLLDGVESFNGNPRHRSRNELAEAFAREHGLLRLSSSDAHQQEDVGRGGMRLPDPISAAQEWVSALAEAQLLCSPEAA